MKRAMLASLRFYKRRISPLLPPACKYTPTCSEYAMQAVERYGAVYGGYLAARRLLRCHPFAKGGYDPVPERVDTIIRKDEN
ncbi:MAG: membrane protein insertion efficiency factor YidD [Clostridiales bacterium]|nr:membrane protein insertion efficiency factor YidD [Eubacteriales bacterium]MCI5766652.1 membrane protein insertion efficiency factor YidD [Clostridiales bacterium]MDD7121982.1 membrane protein insertion efficiency factor YidD [Clostridiales bacterium]